MKHLRRCLRWQHRIHPQRPTVLGFVKALGVMLLAFLALTAQAVAYYQDPGIDGIASRLAARKVEVRCLSKAEGQADTVIASGVSGYVLGWRDMLGRWHPGQYAVFAPGICEQLLAIASGNASGYLFEDLVWAVLVITHESGHLRGARWSGDEARTQCWALQHMRSTLNQLGVRDRSVQSVYVYVALEIQKQMPPLYQPTRCRYPQPIVDL